MGVFLAEFFDGGVGSMGGPRFLCGGFSWLRRPLRLGAFRRSTPIRLHRRDATGTQRKPCCVAVLITSLCWSATRWIFRDRNMSENQWFNSSSRWPPRIVPTPPFFWPKHFTEGTEPSPQKAQSGHGVGLRELGADLGALCAKRFFQKGLIAAGERPRAV